MKDETDEQVRTRRGPMTGRPSGIGLETGRALRRNGYRVFGTSRKAMSDTGDGVTMLVCDVTDDRSVQDLVDEVVRRAGRIDLLVNNAGIGLLGGAEESSATQAKALFDVNVFGVFRVTNAVLPVMRRQGGGRIVNMGSLVGLIPAPFNALYSSSKHAIEGYSESLDHEVRTQGIRVVLVEPGGIRTSFEDNIVRADHPLPEYDTVRTAAEALMRDIIAAGDPPEIVAETVIKAANAAAPKRRYTAGKLAGQVRFIRRFLPESFVDARLRKFNKLPA